MQYKLWNYIFLSACLCSSILALPRRGDHDDVVDPAHLKPANPNDDRPLVTQQEVPDEEGVAASSSSDDGGEIVSILRPRPKKSAQEGDEYYEGDYQEYVEYVEYQEDTQDQDIPNSNEYLVEEEDVQVDYEGDFADENGDGFPDDSEFERKERRTRKTAFKGIGKSSKSNRNKNLKKRSIAKKMNKRSPIRSALKKVVKRSPVQALLKNYEGKRSIPVQHKRSAIRAKKQARKMRSEEAAAPVSNEDENDAIVIESCDSLLEECQADAESPKCAEYEKLCLSPVEGGQGEFEDTFFCEDENGAITTNCISPYVDYKDQK